MPHSICTSASDGTIPYFRRLGRTLFAPNIEPRYRVELLLEHEAAEFDLNHAFLSHIDLTNEREHFETVYGTHEVLGPSITVPLSETYCRKTIADSEGTMAVSAALAEGWENDPAYERFGFESYLGTTVSVNDELYGTLCFADTTARDEPFIDKEKGLLEMYGEWVGYVLTRGEEPPIGGRRQILEGCAVSPEAIDSMMDVLTTRTRRVILRTLLGDTTETSIATLERRLDHENARINLYHIHLPKLVQYGYINWDDNEGTISEGPKFSEVEPLVQLLEEYETEFPQ